MQSLSISEIVQTNKPSVITGYVFLKKNLFWSERYVRMGEGKLSYYEDKTDTTPRGVMMLKDAVIIERYHGKPEVIQIIVKNSSITELLVKIEQPNFRAKFIRCLYDNSKPEDKRSNNKQMKDLSFEDLEQLQNDYPPLPSLYKNYFDQKYYLRSYSGQQIIFSQKIQQKSNNNLKQSKINKIDTFIVGALVGGLSYFGWQAFIAATVLFVIILLITFLSSKRNKQKSSDSSLVKKQIIVNVQLDDIFNILQTFRASIYVNQDVKFIINQQLFFQQGSRYFLIEKDINKLRYMWQFIPNQDKTLVSVLYTADNPEISLTNLYHLSFKIRTVPSKQKSIKNRSTLTGVSGLSINNTPRSRSSNFQIGQSPLKQINEQTQTTIQRKQNSTKFLPSVDEMAVLYPKTPKVLLQQCAQSRKIFMDTINMQYDKTEQKNNCKMSVREMAGGLLVTKGTTKVKGDLDQIVKYVRDLSKRGQYDGMFNSGKLLQQFQISGVLHQKFNGMFPVSSRDFVLLLSVQNIENGIMIHGKSTKFIDFPPDSKTVRGQVLSAGFLLKTIGDMIEITYLTYSDPSGSLPDMIKKKAGAMQSGVILKLRQIMLKKFKQ